MSELIKQLEETYNCLIFYDDGFDDKVYWIATPKDYDNGMFIHAFGITLEELKSNIEKML